MDTYPWYSLEPGAILKRVDEQGEGKINTLVEVKELRAKVLKVEVIKILNRTGNPTAKQIVNAVPGYQIYASRQELYLASRLEVEDAGRSMTREDLLTLCKLAIRGAQHAADHATEADERHAAGTFLAKPMRYQEQSQLKYIAYYADAALFIPDPSKDLWEGPSSLALPLDAARRAVHIIKDSLIEMYVPIGLITESLWLDLQRALMCGRRMVISFDAMPDIQFGELRSCAATRASDDPIVQLTFRGGGLADTMNYYLNTQIRRMLSV